MPVIVSKSNYVSSYRIASYDGLYYVATNPQIGVGVQQGVTQAYDPGKCLLLFHNHSRSYLDPKYLKLICSDKGSNVTSSGLTVSLDLTDRYSSGGVECGSFSTNSGYFAGDDTHIYFGDVVCTSSFKSRIVGRARIKGGGSSSWVPSEQVLIDFDGVSENIGVTAGTTTPTISVGVGPVVVAPGHSMMLSLWNVQTGTAVPPSWEFIFGYVVRETA